MLESSGLSRIDDHAPDSRSSLLNEQLPTVHYGPLSLQYDPQEGNIRVNTQLDTMNTMMGLTKRGAEPDHDGMVTR